MITDLCKFGFMLAKWKQSPWHQTKKHIAHKRRVYKTGGQINADRKKTRQVCLKWKAIHCLMHFQAFLFRVMMDSMLVILDADLLPQIHTVLFLFLGLFYSILFHFLICLISWLAFSVKHTASVSIWLWSVLSCKARITNGLGHELCHINTVTDCN